MAIGRIVKADLKKHFPHIKFSVTSDYNCVRVSWTNGVTVAMVEAITSKYKLGRFDGMTDSYEYSNRRDDVPQVDYVFLSRDISEDIYEARFAEYKAYYGDWENLNDMYDSSVHMQGYNPRGFIRHKLWEVCL
jgi:hypothetical protein